MAIQWPVDNPRVTGEFGNSPGYYAQFGQAGHNGIDLGVPLGTPVYATDDGTVVAEGWGNYDNWMGSIAGIFVRVGHNWGYSAYAHLSSSIVDVGQWVNRGQLIGYSGATGVGTGPHLHFETFPNYPNFGNGFAGRINPHVFGIVPRGTSTAPAKPNPPKPAPTPAQMYSLIGEDAMFYLFLQKKHTYLVIPQGSAQPRAILLGDEGSGSKRDPKIPLIYAHSAGFTMTDIKKSIVGIRASHLTPVK